MSVQFVENDGGWLAVEVRGAGNAAGPWVICAPGLGDTRDAYGPLADTLATAGYRVALVDLRGHGDSSTTFARWGDVAVASDLIKVAETMSAASTASTKTRPRVVLAGTSLSSAAAVIAAAERPDLVAGIVLLGPFLRNGSSAIGAAVARAVLRVALWRPWGPYLWRAYAERLWIGLGGGTSNGSGGSGSSGGPDILSPDSTSSAAARARYCVAHLTRPGRWTAFTRLATALDHDADVAPYLARMHAVEGTPDAVTPPPALVIVGERDPDWSDPRAEAAWVADQLTTPKTTPTTLMVPGAGHAPMLERPAVVGPAVVRFLATLQTSGAFAAAAAA